MHGNVDGRLLPAAMVAAAAMLAVSLQPAWAQREEAPRIERYDFEDLGIGVPDFVSEPIDSLISVFGEDEETPTAEEEALAAEQEALAAEKAALAAEREALAAEKAALAAEKEALAAEKAARQTEASLAGTAASAAGQQAPAAQVDVSQVDVPVEEEDPPREADFVQDLFDAWHDGAALDRALQWARTVADIDMPLDAHGNTALHYAAPARLDVLRTVVALGADCNVKNAYGASPLHVAAAQNDFPGQVSGPGAVALLAECGAELDLRDGLRVTPLHAVYTSVELGLSHRFPLHIVQSRGRYDTAARWRNAYEASLPGPGGGKSPDVLRALLEAGADPNAQDVNGATPLTMAVKTAPYQNHIPLLLKHGADPGAKDIAGRTAIMHAIFSYDSAYEETEGLEAIGALLEASADPDAQDEAGATALIHAARKDAAGPENNGGALLEIELLLAVGADPCIADRSGRLPWDYAEEDSVERDILREAGGARKESFMITDFDGSTYDALEAGEGCDTEAQLEEQALGLDRAARERIQACLVAQGFAAGAPDGVFGPATRRALHAWQQSRPATEATGYLTEEGMAALLAGCEPGPRPRCTGAEGEPSCWMAVENLPDCYIWNPNPQPRETVAWSGSCVDGKVSGEGKTTWRWWKDGAWQTSWSQGPYREGRSAAGHWIVGYSDDGTWDVVRRGEDGRLHGLAVMRGSDGRVRSCWRNGERVEDRRCVAADDRAMRTLRQAGVRSGPGEDYERLRRLPAGEQVEVTGRAGSGSWLQVEWDGGTGFVRAELLEEMPAAKWQAGEVFRDCAGCPEMVVVPAGSFTMGSPSSEEGRWNDEGPQHRVTIPRPFAAGVYEVTFAQWDACAAAGGCGGYRPGDRGHGGGEGRGDRPVFHVSWDDAQAYVRWLSGETGAEYRLLSEAEWEYAARAGTTTAYNTGHSISPGQANFDSGQTVPVGSFAANGFGLHDVHGNVYEWVEDCWNDDYVGAPSDGSAWERGGCSVRVLRGGSWDSVSGRLRSALRLRYASGSRDYDNGFRVARTLTP